MGRIKGKHIKNAAHALVKMYGDKLTADFEKNKIVVKQMGLLSESKKERMKLAGEVTSLMTRRNARAPQAPVVKAAPPVAPVGPIAAA